MVLKSVIRWLDDTVSAFDENGREVCALAGPYESVRREVLARSGPKTVFRRATTPCRFEDVLRGEW